MTELKTLKDFGKIYAEYDRTHNDYSDPNVSVKELRQEAIKWVKEGLEVWEDNYYEETISWIKHFFNLTEEDLK